jgi:hypothetical protein
MTAVPITHPAATRHQFRASVCRLIDRLIVMLDDIDGDPDLEPSCDDEGAIEEDDDRESEASLCGVTFGHGYAAYLGPHGGLTYDLEAQCEDGGHDSDREPEDGE